MKDHTRAIDSTQDWSDFGWGLEETVPSLGDNSGELYIPVVFIPAPRPEHITPTFPIIVAGAGSGFGNAAVPVLPPSWPMASLAATLDPCVVSPLIVVCIRGKTPPPSPANEMPLPPGPAPWFPQSWCDAFNVLCSKGQEPRDNYRGPNTDTSGKTQAELNQICIDINIIEIQVCSASSASADKADRPRVYAVCKDNANQRLFACFRTASQLTDNGAHPAP